MIWTGAIYSTIKDGCADSFVNIEPRALRGPFTPTNEVGTGKRGRGVGRIHQFPDGKGCFCFNWRTGRYSICIYGYKAGQKLSPEELRKIRAEARKERKRYEKELAARQFLVADLAQAIWENADCPMTGHKYLVNKRLPQSRNGLRCIERTKAQKLIAQARGIRHEDGQAQVLRGGTRLLVVPLTDDSGLIQSLQFIDESGRKTFLKGGRKKGLLWRPHDLSFNAGHDGTIGIAEGVATAMSVTLLYSVPCVAAMDAGNLLPAAETLWSNFPDHAITFYADRDKSRVGEEKACEASLFMQGRGAHCIVSLPPFTSDDDAAFTKRTGKAPTDFNDFWILWSDTNE